MKPYSVEIFRPDFTMVGSTNVNEVTYKEDYLTSDENTITVLALPGIEKQDFIRISRGSEEYAGVVTEIGYGTDRSKRLQTISYKPLVELLNTGILFDVNAQGQGTLEEFICDRVRETFIDNPDTLQNIHGLSVAHTSATTDWSLHITPAESGGHYNIVNLMDSVIVPAMQKYGILVKAALDIQNREVHLTVGRAGGGILTIEADLPNIIKKSVTIKQVSADVNKLVLYDSADYAATRTYYLHPDLGYDTYDRDRITPVVCELQAVQHEEGSSFDAAAIRAAHDKFSGLAYSNLIELTMANDDGLVKPELMEFGQEVDIISAGWPIGVSSPGGSAGRTPSWCSAPSGWTSQKYSGGAAMANNIVLKTYRGGSVTPLDDAIIQQTVIATNGIFKGCNVTYARGNVLHVSQGFGMIKGRFFEVYDCEVGVILGSGSGTLQGRLYIHMDLSNADEPIQLLTETASVLADLTGDEDVNYNNTAYDLELATFGVTRTGITNLAATFEKITGASGSGGASTLQRSTEYFKGDFVTCKNAPGWVTLYCTTPGVTAVAEPVEYAGIAEVGDRVTDGTCVFTARDVVGEIDVLKELFTDTETSIAGLEDGLQELREEVIKQAESQDDPIGTIRFMPSTNAGDDWLKCDGSFVNEADYPELVQTLGKLMPSGDKFTLLSSGEVPSQISNGVVYNGRLWMYSFSARKLYGIDLTGNGPIKAIPVTSTSTYFADFIAPSTAKPIALSIVPHHSGNKAKLFLAQIISSGGNNNVQLEYSWVNYFLVFSAEFSGDETTLAVEPPFKTIKKETGTGNMASYYYYPQFNPTLYVPYVVAKMVGGVETYYCAIGTRYYTYGGSSPGALTWADGSTEANLIYTSITTDESTFKNQRLCYGEKNMGELVSLYASTSSSRYYTITSSPSGLFTTESRYTSTTITARGSVCPLNVVGEAKVLATFDTSTFPWASIAEVKTGCIKPNLPMPSSAKVFVDAAAYLWGKGIFLVFVGTGIIFSRTLEAGSFGYLDTTSVLGTITQFGWLGYSQDEQSLYILGQDTSNRVKLAKITLNTNFDYATDGAWLPMIVSDGLPAYIKAKTTE